MASFAKQKQGDPQSIGALVGAYEWDGEIENDLHDKQDGIDKLVGQVVSHERPDETDRVAHSSDRANDSQEVFVGDAIELTILLEVVHSKVA